LLKIISRITSPTRGKLQITGRVASLLEVGTGFHPELTGRENIFLNGAVLGMSRADIRRKFDEIVSFAEVERFLDTPVKRYSSGMYMRLAFAVAAHLEPEILVVDEVLAVGDAEFQKKCLGKMREVGQEGRTVLFVSHNMGAISEFCDRAILLNQGNVYADGTPADIISIYSGKAFHAGSGMIELEDDSNSECSIVRVALLDQENAQNSQFDLSEAITIEIDYVVRTRLVELQMAVIVIKEGIDLFQAFDNDDYADIIPVEPGSYRLRYVIPARVLKEGSYSLRITSGLPNKLYQDVNSGLGFDVSSNTINTFKRSFRKDRQGQIISPGTWHKS
jgi:lipopolysaccharide transport system ATP-binding protein